MANKHLLTPMDGTPEQICFANHAGDFSPTAGNDLRESSPTNVEIVMLDWANGAYIQSTQFDLGTKFAERYSLTACLEMQVAAAGDGTICTAWINASASGSAATGNLGAASGSAGTYTGYSADAATAIRQLLHIGNMGFTDDAVDSVQIGYFGDYYPIHRYGSLILLNAVGQVICDTDDIESHLVLSPVIPEQQ